jgi:HemY protein
LIKFFVIIIQIILVLFVSSFLIQNSFIVSLSIKDFIYSISSTYIFVFILILFIFIFFIQTFYFKTKFKFSKHGVNKKIQNKEKGHEAFVDGMIAIANKDYKKAMIENKKIITYLDSGSSLSLLLKSEVFKIEKKYQDLSLVFEDMIKYKKTENLGYRGLMEQFLRSQDYHHAFIYGEKLFNNNPYIEKIYDTLINIVVKTNNWQQLIIITEKAYSKKIIDKKLYKENKSIAFYEIAKIKQLSEIAEACSYIQKSLKLRENFSPYVKLYVQILIEEKKYLAAKKFLKKTWTYNSHPELKSSIIKLAEDSQEGVLTVAQYIVSSNSNEDSTILLVEVLILEKKWNEARDKLKTLLDVRPKKEVCLLMAKIEEGENNNFQKINSWKIRSEKGSANNIWVCTVSNKQQNEWASVSYGGYFNSLVWKQPNVLNQIQININNNNNNNNDN